jgi:hypothetical protein
MELPEGPESGTIFEFAPVNRIREAEVETSSELDCPVCNSLR